MGEIHFKQINRVTGPEKDKYEFEDLSKKMARVVNKIDFSRFRTLGLSP